MPFKAPSWVPQLAFDPPDDVSICDFILDDKYARHPLKDSRPPFVCGITGKSYTGLEVKERIQHVAAGLSKELGWLPNDGSDWDKVLCIFSTNAIDYLTVAWGTHRLGGIVSPANAAYSVSELAYQLKSSGSQCVFTCAPLLEATLEAAKEVGIPKERVYILEVPGPSAPKEFKTVDQFIDEGRKLQPLEKLVFKPGEGARRIAFLSYSSGTSGLPKGVMITHRNVIANTMQMCTFERKDRKNRQEKEGRADPTQVALGLLPLSHIYGLIVIAHCRAYSGDSAIILPKFEPQSFLSAIQTHKINILYLVPPIIVLMTKNKPLLDKFDLSSVINIFTGAAPLGEETAADLLTQFPSWVVAQGYGLTETCTVVSASKFDDVWLGSSGSLLPSVEARIVALDGSEVTEYGVPGELLVKGPSCTLGYFNNSKATFETYEDGWVRTGDEVVIKKHPESGHEHLFIVDRIKELIKVKGHQVAPAELEAHLLTHHAVNDCAVIPVPDADAGEVPKAFVVKSPNVGLEESDRLVARDIQRHVEKHKTRAKWLKGGVEFIDVIPKSPSGKILRRLLRDKEREKRRVAGPKI
ncbi:phenylacetyl-CoA ligase-like protein [Eremomyces bilateralis CBS 781.70]|uniref:Phenylacetyl-CoA ligase-like protein n=1 Tax=Eremomyces bilateralis CBS 781.70 TaxID=1392243 RepID=A0A6G1GF17_9PEZI|nr:phenylacetyl-CoA ligase-like protein [Eremomyces bilateralis CBS 781.70]KAF1816469.1 phenylacetyl-CoA ligase-like protein [Eremomyces bilateralis CBS 781.70]